jgi:pyruvate kinase
VLAKIESADSGKAVNEILDAVDGAMVPRGDLRPELPWEDVPFLLQNQIIQGCRQQGKPVA